MHQSYIAEIIQVIDDYFLLFDPHSATTIKAHKPHSSSIEGLAIHRDLRNGWLEVLISSSSDDKDSVSVYYHKKGSKNDHDGCDWLISEGLCLQNISKAIRQMIVYDSEVKNPNTDDLVLSPNNKAIH